MMKTGFDKRDNNLKPPPQIMMDWMRENYQQIDGVVSFKTEAVPHSGRGRPRTPAGVPLAKVKRHKGTYHSNMINSSTHIDGEQIKASRKQSAIVWFLVHGVWPEGETIDHINGDSFDDRIENLRIATRRENAQNMGPTPGSKFDYLGLQGYYFDETGLVSAKVSCDYEMYYGIGSTDASDLIIRDSQLEAARDYDWLKPRILKKHGIDIGFCRLNFPDEEPRHPLDAPSISMQEAYAMREAYEQTMEHI